MHCLFSEYTAQCNGLFPKLSVVFTSNPNLSIIYITSTILPARQAICKIFKPSLVIALISAPNSISNLMVSIEG